MSDDFNIRFIRNFTLESCELWLRRELRDSGISVRCQFGGFASAAEEIGAIGLQHQVDANNLTVLALGLEMTAKDFGHASWAAEAACEQHLVLIRSAVEKCGSPLVINTVLPPLFSATGIAVVPGERNPGELVDELNLELRRIAAQNPGRVALIDWGNFARELGEKRTYDYRFWHSSGAPFAASFLMRYAAGIASVVRALSGKIRKCLILDCDNTLWGGIIGEDGREGIELSSDTAPGAYFQAFQRSIIDLHGRGVAIALCSKNNETDVFDIVDNHPDCLIRKEHLATWRVNWNDKVQSIAEIVEELNVGRDAVVFIDDSLHECELVRSALPEVLVLRTPENREDLVNYLDRLFLFDALVVTEADIRRTRSYEHNRAREALSKVASDLSDYKKQLGTCLRVRLASELDCARVTQLLQRTNQFNLTTRRHDQAAVIRMLADPDVLVICAELEDKFGDLGLIGVSIIKRMGRDALIDTMLMSCRALGRDAEVAFAGSVFNLVASKWGVRRIVAEYIPTPKNGLAADFWKRMGLAEGDVNVTPEGRVIYTSNADPLTLASINMPAHITMTEIAGER
jgi:FkbH-like protein